MFKLPRDPRFRDEIRNTFLFCSKYLTIAVTLREMARDWNNCRSEAQADSTSLRSLRGDAKLSGDPARENEPRPARHSAKEIADDALGDVSSEVFVFLDSCLLDGSGVMNDVADCMKESRVPLGQGVAVPPARLELGTLAVA
jgi:hypothetical protein